MSAVLTPTAAPRRSLWLRWWSNHAATLALSVVVLFLSVVMTPSTGFLHLGSFTVPELCAWRRIFGIECLGCGMTRSFVFLGHGQATAAWDINHLGPLLYAIVLFQLPYRTILLARGPSRRDRAREARRLAHSAQGA